MFFVLCKRVIQTVRTTQSGDTPESRVTWELSGPFSRAVRAERAVVGCLSQPNCLAAEVLSREQLAELSGDPLTAESVRTSCRRHLRATATRGA